MCGVTIVLKGAIIVMRGVYITMIMRVVCYYSNEGCVVTIVIRGVVTIMRVCELL